MLGSPQSAAATIMIIIVDSDTDSESPRQESFWASSSTWQASLRLGSRSPESAQAFRVSTGRVSGRLE